MKRALISVSDKTDIAEFALRLTSLGWEIISTGGTYRILQERGIDVKKVAEITDFPEIMEGRVKTLHPKIHGGILAAREEASHMQEATLHGIKLIDLVVVNLYPFEQTCKNPHAEHAEIIENIDIGGPSMIRAAAKNYKYVGVVTASTDYPQVIEQLEKYGELSFAFKEELAYKAFCHTAHYDTVIADYFSKLKGEYLPQALNLSYPLAQATRYGENPHQKAAFYEKDPLIEQLHGIELSYNNLADIDAALLIIEPFTNPCVAIVKHMNPCGIGQGETLVEAYEHAFATDPLSPFGGIVIVNRELDLAAAQKINEVFTEIILAPAYTAEALQLLMKKKNRRLCLYRENFREILKNKLQIKSCLNGFLAQEKDLGCDEENNWQVVTKRQPTAYEWKALKFAWKVVKVLKSNAVCFTDDKKTLGIGLGQTSRIDCTEIAIRKTEKFGHSLSNAVCASDAFFPFRDSMEAMQNLGVKAVIQPGGSKGDADVIKAADEFGIAMIFTGMRHFRH